MNGGRPLHLGVVVDSLSSSRYVFDLLQELRERANARLVVVLAPAGDPGREIVGQGPGFWRDLAARLLLASEYLGLRALGASARGGHWLAKSVRLGSVDISGCFEHAIELGRESTRAGELPEVDLFLVLGRWVPSKSEFDRGSADLIQLELGGGLVHGTSLIGFREAEGGLAQTPVRLYRISGDGGSRACLLDGLNRTRPLFSLNQAAVWGRGMSVVCGHLANLEAGWVPRPVEQRPAPGSVNDDWPGVGRLLAYPLRVLRRGALAITARRRGERRWSVAIGPADSGWSVKPESLEHLVAPPGMWYADPILYRRPETGCDYCFVEEFDEAAGRAHIAVLQRDRGQWVRLGVALKEPFHLSFPFVLDYEGEVYMCPETSEAKGIFVYRCEEFPLKWRLASTLMSGVSATDTMLFEHGGRWWMLSNIDRSPNPDHQSELHVFHADSPLSTSWRPIPGNPVKVDSRGARNGGLAIAGGLVHRIGQVQSFEMYGRQLLVHRIIRLEPDRFEEAVVGSIAPPEGTGAVGTHTFSLLGNLAAVDLVGPRD